MDFFPERIMGKQTGYNDILTEEHKRRILFVHAGVILTVCLVAAYTVIYIWQGWWSAAIFNVTTIIAHSALFFGMRRKSTNGLIACFFLLLIAQLFIASNVFLGQEAGVHYFLFCMLPFLCIAFPHKRDIAFIAVIGAADMLAFLYTEYAALPSPFLVDSSGDVLTNIHMASTTGTILLISGLVFILYMDISRAKNALAREHERSESLLLNILPGSIANQLKATSSAVADTCRDASVLFADIAGFTALAAGRSPADLVAILNRYFCCYDELVEKYGVEKIKTIGDAYMAVAGVPERRDDHAAVLMSMASEMITRTEQISRESGLDLAIRIGIHSGEVTAGVIGKKKFAYDLWGDTVNIASRMESHGIPGRIQVSPRTRDLLKTSFAFEPRGAIEIKGMGLQETYLLKK